MRYLIIILGFCFVGCAANVPRDATPVDPNYACWKAYQAIPADLQHCPNGEHWGACVFTDVPRSDLEDCIVVRMSATSCDQIISDSCWFMDVSYR